MNAVCFYSNLVLLKFRDERIDFIHVYSKVTGRGMGAERGCRAGGMWRAR